MTFDIIMDVDGVVADFVGGCVEVLGLPSDFEQHLTQWEFIEGLPEHEKALLRRWLKLPSFWSELAVMPLAQLGIEELRRAGHHIIWATSPWKSCREWAYQRREWLRRNHFLLNEDDLVFTSNKRVIAGTLIIDDRLKHIAEWHVAQGGRGLIFDHPYNRNYTPSYAERFTWAQVPRWLLR